MNLVKQFMIKSCDFIQLLDMYYHDDVYFLLKFKTHKAMEIVMMNGSYSIRNMTMLLRKWKSGFNLKDDMLCALPI